MFVGDVESVQTAEGVIPSSVRVLLADEFYRSCARSIESFDGARSKMGLARTYWECGVIAGHSFILANERNGEMVKSRAQVVDTVAHDGAPFGRDGLALEEAVDFVTRLRICIYDMGMGFSALESANGRAKVRKMLFGPVNLYPNAVQRIRHGQVRSNERPRISEGGASLFDYATTAA
jgi:hypothetical protein